MCDMREIQVGGWKQNSPSVTAFVDDEDYELVSQFKWSIHHTSHTLYAARRHKDGYEMMHWLLMGEKHVDHIDHNGLNNQRSNLRSSGQLNNNRNVRKLKPTSSQYKGVSWDKSKKKWAASITVNYKGIFLGRYAVEEEAARAYDEAALLHFGEFAYLNFGGDRP